MAKGTRRAVAVSLGLALLLGWGRVASVSAQKSQDGATSERFRAALESVEARVVETDIVAWVEAGARFSTPDQLAGLVEKARVELGLPRPAPAPALVNDERFHSATVGPVSRGGVDYVLCGQSTPVDHDFHRPAATMLMLKARFDKFSMVKAALEGTLATVGSRVARVPAQNVSTFLTMVGRLPHGTSRETAERAARRIVEALGGKNRRTSGESGWTSITAFSSKLGRPIKLGDDVVNLNVALHEDPESHDFYIVVGTPLITEDY